MSMVQFSRLRSRALLPLLCILLLSLAVVSSASPEPQKASKGNTATSSSSKPTSAKTKDGAKPAAGGSKHANMEAECEGQANRGTIKLIRGDRLKPQRSSTAISKRVPRVGMAEKRICPSPRTTHDTSKAPAKSPAKMSLVKRRAKKKANEGSLSYSKLLWLNVGASC